MISNVKKKFNLTLPAKATVFYTLTGAAERGISFIFTPIYTRILTPEEYGLYPLYVSWMGIATVIVTFELCGSTLYRGLANARGREDEFISSAMGLFLSISFVSSILILLTRDTVSALTGLSTDMLSLLLLQTVINGVIGIYFAKCRFTYKYKTASLINLASAVVTPALALAVIRLTSYRAEARIIAPLLFGCAIALPILVSIFRKGRRFFDTGVWKNQIFTVLPLLPHFLATTVSVNSGKLAIARFFGEDALAKYSLVFSFGFIFTVITVGINSGLTPWINRKLSHGVEVKVGKLCDELFSLFSVLAIITIVFVPEGLSILAPDEYLEALIAVYPLTLSVIISFLTAIFHSITVFYGKGHLITLGSVATALLTVLLHATVTRRLGYLGAGLVAAATGLLSLLVYAVILGGVLKKRIFSFKKISAALLLSAFFACLLYTLRESILSRTVLLLALLLILIPKALDCYRLARENGNG